MKAAARTCPVCKQLVEPTHGNSDGANVLQHSDKTKVTICPMSGQPFELTYAVQGAVTTAQRVVA